jgi:DNA-directed RNA polymerase subunit RPC12/RpoP
MYVCNKHHIEPVDVPMGVSCCTQCGADFHSFMPVSMSGVCTRLHDKDLMACARCGYRTLARSLVRRVNLVQHRVTCPTCQGAGYVNSPSQIRRANGYR